MIQCTGSGFWRAKGRWAALALLLVGAALFFGAFPRLLAWRLHQQAFSSPPSMNAQAQSLHSKLLVVDLHAATLLWSRDLLARGAWGHVDLPRLTDGNVALQVFSAVTAAPWRSQGSMDAHESRLMAPLVVAQLWPPRTWDSLLERARYQADKLNRFIRRAGSGLIAIRTKADLDRLLLARSQAQANGITPPVGVMLSLDGPHVLEGELANLDRLFDAGFRMAVPPDAVDDGSAIPDSSARDPAVGASLDGVMSLGRLWLRRMEEKGMVVDLANAPQPTLREVLANARQPVVASHTGLRGTCNTPRNLSDEQARGIAGTGGLIGIGYGPQAVCDVSIDAVVKAIRYAVALVGIDHVALGSNFDGAARTPMDAAGLAHLTHALTAAGFSDGDIGKLAGANAWRVLRSVLPS